MEPFILCRDGRAADIILEQNSVPGMSLMTDIFCGDIERVCGVYPEERGLSVCCFGCNLREQRDVGFF